MTVVYIISFLLIAFGIVRILGLTPESIGADVSAILDRKKSLRDNAMRARGKKRTNKVVLWLDKIRRALSDTGKEKSFGVACAVALLLMILGCVGAIVIGNPFLAPVLAIALAMIPFLYLLRTVEQYEEQVKLELESITYGNCEGERMTYRYFIGNDLNCFRKYCEADDILARVRELIRENESQFEV